MNKKEILDYIKEHPLMHLSTINSDGFPECRTVINLINKESAPHLTKFAEKTKKIYIMTNTCSAKVAQISDNSKSSLYFVDHENYSGLLLMGHTIEVKDVKTKKNIWDEGWDVYYKDGFEGGDFSVLEFIPERYKLYGNLTVIDNKIKW